MPFFRKGSGPQKVPVFPEKCRFFRAENVPESSTGDFPFYEDLSSLD